VIINTIFLLHDMHHAYEYGHINTYEHEYIRKYEHANVPVSVRESGF
jgi:hypothetical protein